MKMQREEGIGIAFGTGDFKLRLCSWKSFRKKEANE